jgi:hypothetical protein
MHARLGSAYFYARRRPVWQVQKDREEIWDTLGDGFFSFLLKKYG